MENLNNVQIEAELVLINNDINSIINESKVDKKLIDNDINYIIKQRKIDCILLDEDQAKNNIKMLRLRKEMRINGEKYEMYNSAS